MMSESKTHLFNRVKERLVKELTESDNLTLDCYPDTGLINLVSLDGLTLVRVYSTTGTVIGCVGEGCVSHRLYPYAYDIAKELSMIRLGDIK